MATKAAQTRNSAMKEFFTFKRDSDYYNDSVGRKIADFFIGIGFTVLPLIIGFLVLLIGSPAAAITSAIISYAFFFGWVAAIVLAVIGKRKYLLLGLFVVPACILLIFGACLIMLGGIGIFG